ncbi:COX assembly mitochondrial protein homolog [Lynx canadensis]|nr:COX assembly mitochondrial protein homolog [Lynx canadensis]
MTAQALTSPTLLSCRHVTAQRILMGVSCSSVKKASERYKALPAYVKVFEGLQRTSGHMQELGLRRFAVVCKTCPTYKSLVAQRSKTQKGRHRNEISEQLQPEFQTLRERREGFGRELSRHGRRSPKGQQLRLGSPQTRVCKRALALRPKLRGGARRAQAQCAAEVATREIRRKERGLRAGLREGHCAPPPWLPPPRGSSGRPHVPPCPDSSPSLPLPGSGRGLLSSPPAEMALDPAEQHLRHVEKDVLIPKIMREKARERCSEQVQDFTKCCKDSGILMVVKCRKENSALKECLTAHYNDPAFYEECKMEYLKEREEFRKTGIPTKKRLQKLPTSM